MWARTGLVLAAGGAAADFPAVANGVEEAAVAGSAGVAARELLPEAGLQETDAAAGGTLLPARSLQFCGQGLPGREEEEEGKSWRGTTCWQ